MLHYFGVFIGSLFGASSSKRDSDKQLKVTSLRSLWFVWIFLIACACMFAFIAFLSLTSQRLVDLSDISTTQSIQPNGMWAKLDSENYRIVGYVGEDKIAPGQFSYKYRTADIFIIDVLSDSGSYLYPMYMMTDRVTFEADKPDVFGQCWSLRQSMLDYGAQSDFYIVQAYLLDKGQTMFSYIGTVALSSGVCLGCCWLLWFLPRKIKKRNAEIEERLKRD